MITYFKVVYRRHTNFAMESIEQTFNGVPNFGNKVSALISRNGDLVSGVTLQATLPDLTKANLTAYNANLGLLGPGPHRRYTRWVDNVGHYLIKEVTVSIGGQQIDKHYSDWLEIWSQLTVPAGQMEGYLQMIGQDPKNALGQNTGLQADQWASAAATATPSVPATAAVTGTISGRELYIPLQFWFCRNVGLALPLIALQYHEVKIGVEFRPAHELVMLYVGDGTTTWATTSALHTTNTTHAALDASLWVDYIYLDTDERRRFAQVSHEYLIEQLQFTGNESGNGGTDATPRTNSVELNFNHPVKELVWVVKANEVAKEWANFTNTGLPVDPPFATMNNDGTIGGIHGMPTRTTAASLGAQTVTLGGLQNTLTEAELLTALGACTGFVVGDQVIAHGAAGVAVARTIDNVTGGDITGVDPNGDLTGFTPGEVVTFHVRPGTGANATTEYDYTPNGQQDITTLTPRGLADITTLDAFKRLTNYDSVCPMGNAGNTLASNPVATAKLQLNGHDRFAQRDGEYFSWVQCKNHHSGIPKSPGINVYSFALKPEDHQPSGTCNFSRIDNAKLILTLGGNYRDSTETDNVAVTIKVFAINYNVLRIMSGMGGLAYSN